MKRMSTFLAAVLLGGGLMLARPAVADDRPADVILKELDALAPPTVDRDRVNDQEYVQAYMEQYNAYMASRSELIFELYKAHPKHEKLASLLPERWNAMSQDPEQKDAMEAELKEVIASDNAALALTARYTKAQIDINMFAGQGAGDKALAAAEAFINAAPDDERGARLLSMVTRAYPPGSEGQRLVNEKLMKLYPDSSAAKYAKGKIRQAEAVGKPFELAFTDAISGKEITMKDLKDQVVVIDFWATWCGPCIAEMPNMKELYATYHQSGVEFIGVSLDQPEEQGGLQALRDYVKENEVPWPQYYQGKGWDSDFSASWGINSIPALFIVDKDGNLHSVNARGKLEQLIPELLGK